MVLQFHVRREFTSSRLRKMEDLTGMGPEFGEPLKPTCNPAGVAQRLGRLQQMQSQQQEQKLFHTQGLYGNSLVDPPGAPHQYDLTGGGCAIHVPGTTLPTHA